uniref:DUF1619 domain-containing protein n=1 Tax=Caenorhabditis japonica TaxID=281687 RepID=A0A8R1I454_CAEJA
MRISDDIGYEDVEIEQSVEHWNQYANSKRENKNTEKNPDLLTFGSQFGIRLFKLPAAISETDFCTGTQNVEMKRNLTVRCKPLSTTDMLSQCTENSFLSALALFGNGEFIQRRENETVEEVPRISPEQLRSPVWNGSMCNGVVKTAHLVFHLNETKMERVEVHVQYDVLPSNVDNNWFEQTFSVEWIPVKLRDEEEQKPSGENRTEQEMGYKDGEQIFRFQDSGRVPYTLPTLGHCYSGEISPTPVNFLRPLTCICTITTINCEDARAKAKMFYKQVYPSEFVSSPSEDAHSAKVGRDNVTWEQMSSSVSSCRLPVSSLLQIYYSKIGSIKSYREVIVAGNVQIILDDIPYLPGQLIRMPLRISFTDVTAPPKSLFAALPYIDIRLPHDFFYPFISSSSNFSFSIYFMVIMFMLLRF